MSPPLAGVFLTTGPLGKSETMLSYTHFYESIDSAIIVQFHSHFSEHPPRSPCKRTELACFPLTIADLFLKEIYYIILYYYITLLNYIINHLFHFFIVNLLSPSVSLSLSLTHTHTHTHAYTVTSSIVFTAVSPAQETLFVNINEVFFKKVKNE